MNYKKIALYFLLLFSTQEALPNNKNTELFYIIIGGACCAISLIAFILLYKKEQKKLDKKITNKKNKLKNITENIKEPKALPKQQEEDSLDNLNKLIERHKKEKTQILKSKHCFPKNNKLLFYACYHNLKECVTTILTMDYYAIDINQSIQLKNGTKRSPLLLACQYGYGDIVSLLLKQPTIQLVYSDHPSDHTALNISISYKQTDTIKILLTMHDEHKFPMSAYNKVSQDDYFSRITLEQYWGTALIEACTTQNKEIITMLLNNKNTKKTFETLSAAITTGNLNIVKMLIDDKNNFQQTYRNNDYRIPYTYTDVLRAAAKEQQNEQQNLILEYLISPDTIKILQEKSINKENINPNNLWRELFALNENDKTAQSTTAKKAIIKLLIKNGYIHIDNIGMQIKNEIRGYGPSPSMHPIEFVSAAFNSNHKWINYLIDECNIDYTINNSFFIFLGLTRERITSFDELNFFKKLSNVEKIDLKHTILNGIIHNHTIINFIEDQTYQGYDYSFGIDDFIDKFLPDIDLTKKNSQQKTFLDIAYTLHKTSTTPKNPMPLNFYYSFLRRTPYIQPLEIFFGLQHFAVSLPKEIHHIILNNYMLLTAEREQDRQAAIALYEKIKNKKNIEYHEL